MSPRMQRLVEAERLDAKLHLFRNRNREALDLDSVLYVLDVATLFHARAFAAEDDGHLELQALIGRDAREINVQHFGAERIPLQLAK